MVRGASFMTGTCSKIPTIVPSKAMKSMSKGMQVVRIQNVRCSSSCQENSMPLSDESSVLYISPRARWLSRRAISTEMVGDPVAAGKLTVPCGNSKTGPGSVGQCFAGRATGGASAGVSTRQAALAGGLGAPPDPLTRALGTPRASAGVRVRGSTELGGSSARLQAGRNDITTNTQAARIGSRFTTAGRGWGAPGVL